MKILYIYADTPEELNTSTWRCINPAKAINKYGEMAKEIGAIIEPPEARVTSFMALSNKDPQVGSDLQWADIIIMERLLISNVVPYILDAQAAGKVVIGDVDDAYHLMPKNVYTYPFWHEGKFTALDEDGKEQQATMATKPVEQLAWSLKLVNAVSSPSEKLLEYWSKFGVKTISIPNFIPAENYLPHARDLSNPKLQIIIGWGGSPSHQNSWHDSDIIPALRTVLGMHPEVKLVLAGNAQSIAKYIDMPGRITVISWTEFEDWPKTLATFDIGLIPLAGSYDEHRSWIKSLEYTLMGIPWIGTRSASTTHFAAYGTLVPNKYQQWTAALEKTIRNYSNALSKVKEGKLLAVSCDLMLNVPYIVNKYAEIYNEVSRKIAFMPPLYDPKTIARIRVILEDKYGSEENQETLLQ